MRQIILLPERRRLSGASPSRMFARALTQATCEQSQGGEQAQLRRYFHLPESSWPMAALMRDVLCADAANYQWLRVDTASLRAELSGVRLLACGDNALTHEESEALLAALQPLFADIGELVAATPNDWLLRLPLTMALPEFAAPECVLGDDVFAHMPQGEIGRPWRSLLNEVQICLHNHPLTSQRLAAGLPPINSVWFWGGGELPERIIGDVARLQTDALDLRALAAYAQPSEQAERNELSDFRDARNLPALEAAQLIPTLQRLYRGELSAVILDFADGAIYRITRWQRLRFWRRLQAVFP